MSKVEKRPLDLALYEKYNIPQKQSAFKISFYQIQLDRCDDIEAEYQSKGYQIFHTELRYEEQGFCFYEIIVSKLGYTF